MTLEQWQVADIANRNAALAQALAVDTAYRVYRETELQRQRDATAQALSIDLAFREHRDADLDFRRDAQVDNLTAADRRLVAEEACRAVTLQQAEAQALIAARMLLPVPISEQEMSLRQIEVAATVELAAAISQLAAAISRPTPVGDVPPATERIATSLGLIANKHQLLAEVVWTFLQTAPKPLPRRGTATPT